MEYKTLSETTNKDLMISITACFQLDLSEIDLERWKEILPLAAELIQNPDGEIMTQSPSQTVSIYEALAEILSKPTESLNYSNNKSTDRTPFSEAPVSSTTTSTTTTTTSTTPRPPPTTEAIDDLKVENSTLDGLDYVVHTASVNNQQLSSESSSVDDTNSIFTTQLPHPLQFVSQPDPNSPEILYNTTTTDDMRQNSTVMTTTTLEPEYSSVSVTTDEKESSIDFEISMTNNVTKVSTSVTNNDTEIKSLQESLLIDKNRSSLKPLGAGSPNTSAENSFGKTSTVPPNYSPRFTPENRIPILSSGFQRGDRKLASQLSEIDLMTMKVTKQPDDRVAFSTPSVFPVYRPELETTTLETVFSTTTHSSIADQLVVEAKPTVESLIEVENATTQLSKIVATETASRRPIETTTFDTLELEDLIEEINDLPTVSTEASTEVSETNDFNPRAIECCTELNSDSVRDNPLTTEHSLTTKMTSTEGKLHKNIVFGTKTEHNHFKATVTDKLTTSNQKVYTTTTETPSTKYLTTTTEYSTQPTLLQPSGFTAAPKNPKSLFQSPRRTQKPTEPPPKVDERVAYAILPNNTVVKKIILQRLTTENPYVIYGIFPNRSVVRKFRNGTIIPDENTTRFEITNIDPQSLTNPNSEFYQQMSQAATTNLPKTEHTKTVLAPLTYLSIVFWPPAASLVARLCLSITDLDLHRFITACWSFIPVELYVAQLIRRLTINQNSTL